jgi:hypothetical protein
MELNKKYITNINQQYKWLIKNNTYLTNLWNKKLNKLKSI